MANFGLQQYYTNAQQNRFQAEEAAKERDWRSSEAWKSFGRDLLGRLGQTGMNIGQAFAEDYTPTREQAREFGKTKMGWEASDRDTAAARARAEADLAYRSATDPYGEAGRPADVPGVKVPTVQSGATPLTPTGPPQSLVQEKMRNVGGMSVPPATGMSMLPPVAEADKARKAQGAVQPAAAPRVVPPTSTPTPPAGAMPPSGGMPTAGDIRSRYTFTSQANIEDLKNQALKAIVGEDVSKATPDQIALAQQAAAGVLARQREAQSARQSAITQRDLGIAQAALKGLTSKTSLSTGGKYGAKASFNPYLLDENALRYIGTGAVPDILKPQDLRPPGGGAVGGGGSGMGGRYPQNVGGVIESGKGKTLTASQAYASILNTIEDRLANGTDEEKKAAAELQVKLAKVKPGSPEFNQIYDRFITGKNSVIAANLRGQDTPSTRGARKEAADKAAQDIATRRLTTQEQEVADKHDYRERRLQLLERNMAGRVSAADQLAIRNLYNQIRMDTEDVQTIDKDGSYVTRKVPGSKSAAAQEQLDAIIAKYAGGGGGAAPAPAPSAASTAAPRPGEVRNGYVFLGGNPNDPNSWKAQ